MFSPELLSSTWSHLESFASIGLRTLLIAKRTICHDEYATWSKKYHEASTSILNREKKMEDAQEEVEINLEIIGVTAIEDKLQDDVGNTIDTLKKAGIKVWVLTGDKVETAINIGLIYIIYINLICKIMNSDILKKKYFL